MTTAEATTPREWQRMLVWPPDPEDLAKLDELVLGRVRTAEAKARELGLPEAAVLWVSEYRGESDHGTHRFIGRVPMFWDGYGFLAAMHKQGGWREVYAWADGSYRLIFIRPSDRLILTYCEGDLSLEFAATRAAFSAALRRAHEFYVIRNR